MNTTTITKTCKSIWVTFQKEGIHRYPEALVLPELQDVSFLGHSHRHIFHFKVEVPVGDSNREIEFIQFKRWLENLYDTKTLTLNNASCEMMAEALCNLVLERYTSIGWVTVNVSEDGENGSEVTIEKVDQLND